jgi:hypothetical protein
MPKRKKSSKAPNKSLRVIAPEQASVDPRMGVPLHPPGTKFDYPDKMVPWPEEYDPLPKPALTVTWSEANVPEFIAIEMRAMHHFSKLGLLDRDAGRYPKRDDVIDYYKQQRLSDGSLISPRRARELAPNLRPVEARKGGNQKVVPKG